MADLPVTDRIVIPAVELTERFSRSSGPGGQKVNTSDSRVELVWSVRDTTALDDLLRERVLTALRGRLVNGTVVIVASAHRSQLRNREDAAARLAQLVRSALQSPPRRRRSTPSKGSVQRRLTAKKQRSQVKKGRARPEHD